MISYALAGLTAIDSTRYRLPHPRFAGGPLPPGPQGATATTAADPLRQGQGSTPGQRPHCRFSL